MNVLFIRISLYQKKLLVAQLQSAGTNNVLKIELRSKYIFLHIIHLLSIKLEHSVINILISSTY